jgi:hypothetical protein
MRLVLTVAVLCSVLGLATCQHEPIKEKPPEAICDLIEPWSIVPAPGTGTTSLCVAPTDCREDNMAEIFSSKQCALQQDKCTAGSCQPANQLCRAGLKETGIVMKSCKWDRDGKTCDEHGNHYCTCDWELPKGKSIECGCACKS